MKTPSALEPAFSTEDWALVEEIEAGAEAYLEAHPDSTHVNFVPFSDPRWKRRHWNEVIRRMRAAGWEVKPNGNLTNVLVTRPPLPETSASRER